MADLVRAEVRFVTVGGVACAFSGYLRTTEDVDILVDSHPDNVRRLLAALAGFGEGHARELKLEDFGDEEGAVRVVEEFPLDIFTRMGGRRFADLVSFVEVRRLGDVDIPYLNIQGLIVVKGESLRERDRMDVAALRQLLAERESR